MTKQYRSEAVLQPNLVEIPDCFTVFSIAFSGDGKRLYAEVTWQAVNLWALGVYYWPEHLGALVGSLVLAFLFLARRAVSRPRRPGQRYCRKCNYEIVATSGVDTAIEALGSAKTFAACVSCTRPGGTISNVRYHGEGDSVPIPRLDWGVGMSDTTIRTALCPGGSERMGRLMGLIQARRVDPLAMTTHRFRFIDIEKAFRMMQTKEDGIIKPLISFG